MAAASCTFFDKLPPEMRNRIYEFAFSDDESSPKQTDEVDLTKATPPSKSLLLTCRQAYIEGAQIYKSSYRTYWTDSSFTIPYNLKNYDPNMHSPCPDNGSKILSAVHDLPQQEAAHIQHLSVRCISCDPGQHDVWEMVDTRGGWVRKRSDKPDRWIWWYVSQDDSSPDEMVSCEEEMQEEMDGFEDFASLEEQIQRLLFGGGMVI